MKIFQKYVNIYAQTYVTIRDENENIQKCFCLYFVTSLLANNEKKRYEFMNENQNWGEQVRDRNMRPLIMIMNSSSNYVYIYIQKISFFIYIYIL